MRELQIIEWCGACDSPDLEVTWFEVGTPTTPLPDVRIGEACLQEECPSHGAKFRATQPAH